MATTVSFNGTNYSVPSFGDSGWAQGPGNLSLYLVALASGTLQTVGGNFTLSNPVNFGAVNGLIAAYFQTFAANPATAGVLRLANGDTIDWRNFANTGNLALGVNGSDQLTFGGVPVATAPGGTITANLIGNVTGDVTGSLFGNATTATTATNLAGGAAGEVPYQTAPGATGFTAAGTTGQVFQSNGTGAPTWVSPGPASNLSGGAAGEVVYQTAPSSTGFTAAGTPGQVFTSQGAGTPTWTTATSANTPNTIVERDGSGNFSAGTITADLTGTASNATTAAAVNGVTVSGSGTTGQVLTLTSPTTATFQTATAVDTVARLLAVLAFS